MARRAAGRPRKPEQGRRPRTTETGRGRPQNLIGWYSHTYGT